MNETNPPAAAAEKSWSWWVPFQPQLPQLPQLPPPPQLPQLPPPPQLPQAFRPILTPRPEPVPRMVTTPAAAPPAAAGGGGGIDPGEPPQGAVVGETLKDFQVTDSLVFPRGAI